MIVLAAALVIPNMLSATGRADSNYSATLQASLSVSEFLDAERNSISKPAGLTLWNVNTFFDDPLIFIEGDATANADAAIDVTAEDPFDLVAGDRFEIDLVVAGTTIIPTGFSYASSNGIVQIVVDNVSADPVTIVFDFDYEYAVSTSVDDPGQEAAFAFVDFDVSSETESALTFYFAIENNDSGTESKTGSFELTLSPGQSETLTAIGGVAASAYSVVPEPSASLLGLLATAIVSAAGRRRNLSLNGGRPCR